MNTQLITIDPDIHSGTPVFAGTRVPVKTLFDHLEAGDSLEVFLEDFPSVSRDLAVAVLDQRRPDKHALKEVPLGDCATRGMQTATIAAKNTFPG